MVIWKRSPQGHGYVKAWISSFHSMSSISTSSYDILLSAPGSCLFRLSATHSLVNLWHLATLYLFLSLFFVFLSLCNTLTYQSMTSCHPLSLSPTANLQNNIIPGVIFLNYALEPYSIIHHTYRNFNCKASRRKTKQKEKQKRRCFNKRKGNEWELWQPKLTHKFFFFSSSCRPSSPFLCSWILLA